MMNRRLFFGALLALLAIASIPALSKWRRVTPPSVPIWVGNLQVLHALPASLCDPVAPFGANVVFVEGHGLFFCSGNKVRWTPEKQYLKPNPRR